MNSNDFLKRKGLSVLATVLILAGCDLKSAVPSGGNPEIVPVKIAEAVPALPYENIEVSGLLASEKEIWLSFMTGGIIQKILVKEGDNVAKGTLLASLNLTEVKARVEQAQQNFDKTSRDLARTQRLFRDSVATKEQLENAETADRMARQALEIARYSANYSVIRAPGAGIIVSKKMSEGEMTAPGIPVFLFTGAGAFDWILKCGVSDQDWARIDKGLAALVGIDAYPGVVFQGSVTQLSQGTDSASELNRLEIRVDPQGKKLATGLFGKARISVPSVLQGWTVPFDALVEGQGNDAFIFLPRDGKARKTRVTILQLGAGTATVQVDLGADRMVIVEGAAYLQDGSLIALDRS